MKLARIEPRLKQVDVSRGAPIQVERIRGRELDRIRLRILLRDEYTCLGCGRVSLELEVDHIVPLHLGGAESDENRQSLCPECHEAKTRREQAARDEPSGKEG